jgi:hypothetical protein
LSEIEGFRQRHIAKKAIGVNSQIAGWRFAAILPGGRQSPVEVSRRCVGFEQPYDACGKNERAFVGNESLPRQFGLAAGGDPQRTGESGDNDGRESGDGSAVGVNKLPAAANVPINQSDPAGSYIVFGGGVLVGLLVLFYAALKDWREGTFREIKGRQQNDKRNYKHPS